MQEKISPLSGQVYARVHSFTDSNVMGPAGTRVEARVDLDSANVITSMVEGDEKYHKLIIDLDMPVKLLESSTPGHYHLLVDQRIHELTFWPLMHALVEAGLVEPGYVGASEARGYTAVRLPWIKKGEETYHCKGCGKAPDELDEYVRMAEDEGYASPFEAVRRNEGTFNRQSGTFWCTNCYVQAGMPNNPF